MQKLIATCRLTKDSEIRYSADGKAVAKVDIAIGKRFKREGEADADFFSCVAFGKTAEAFEKCNVSKGTKILIEGEVQNNNYTNKEGQRVYGTQILINSFEFCENKGTAQPSQETPQAAPSSDGFMSIPDGIDDLPFS